MFKADFLKSVIPAWRLYRNCHPGLVSGSHEFVTIRNYEILNQVQNDNLTLPLSTKEGFQNLPGELPTLTLLSHK